MKKNESYVNFDLPKYFDFTPLITALSERLNGKALSDFYSNRFDQEKNKQKSNYPSDYEKVNYKFLNNKDGKYDWRPFQLIHPAIYVSLVHSITTDENWETISKRFNKFGSINNINCYSIPLKSEDDKSDKATSISNWWESIEQQSIEYALSYDYVLHIDLSDCYGSIYTHSISWALHTRKKRKKKKETRNLSEI